MAYQSEIEKLQRRYEEKPEQWFAAYADAYRKTGELDVALEIVRSGIEERPNYVSGYIVLGRCLVDQGKDDEAQEAFEQVLSLDAENIIALSNLGEVAERAGDLGAARRWLERLLEVDPMNEKARDTLAGLAAATEAAAAAQETAAGPESGGTPDAMEAHTHEAEGESVSREAAPEPTGLPPLPVAESDAEKTGLTAPEPGPYGTAEPPSPFAPEEPTAGLEPADVQSELPPGLEDDLSSAFAPPPPTPTPPPSAPEEPPASAAADEGEEHPERSRFFIERQSDPFETPREAQVAEEDAAALWATLGEDPELASVPDSESTPSGAPPVEGAAEAERDEIDLGELPALESAEAADEESVAAPPEVSEPAPAGGTTQMSAAELNRLVERERREAEERRAEPAEETEPPVTADETAADQEVIGAPPPEYQLDTPEPQRPIRDVPVFSDPELLADELETGLDAGVVEETPELERPAGFQPFDETPAMQESESRAPEVGPEPEESIEPEEPETAAPAAREADDVVTETMAEVYAAQGLFGEAKAVYRKLLERRPGDTDLQDRLSAVEHRERDADRPAERVVEATVQEEPAAREYAASRTGGVTARSFLSALLAERPRAVSVETAVEPSPATLMDETFASDRSDSQGEPTRPAGDEMSLASVFGDRTPDTGEHRRPSGEHVSAPPPPTPPPPPSAPPPPAASPSSQDDVDMSFDSFFAGNTEAGGGPPSEEGSEGDDDDEDFKAWLKSLKS